MKKIALATALLAGGATAFAATPTESNEPDDLDVQVFTLSNGMQVWLDEDHAVPVVFGGVAVRAGARDCPDTGIAHYFEHIMFKGTEKIGTTDYAAEKPILDSIEAQYALLERTADAALRRQILAEINRLTIEDAQYTVLNEFAQLIAAFGGTQLNAGTSYDYTVYGNLFSANNLEPWLELNSERLLHPVFRLFQSELETVYEEKNMYSDDMVSAAMEHVLDRVFAPHPYAKPVIGSTANLKNPDMAAMRAFYEKYYVAGNMALLLCGDFDTAEALPLIEKYFSRIPAGEVVRPVAEEPAAFQGRETDRIKAPIPIVRAGADVWRTVPRYDADEPALRIAASLLSNDNGTGYLDRLTKDRKVMMAGAMNFSLDEAGIFGIAYVPKMLFTGLHGAEKRVLAAIEKLRGGDFTDEELASAKMEYAKGDALQLENLSDRANTLVGLYTAGKTWADYREEQQRFRALTREDIIAAVNKYLGDDRLVLTKKTGSYPKDKLEKPGFAPVKPQTGVTQSEYGKALVAEHPTVAAPRFIDVAKDMSIGELPGGDTLFVVKNPYNRIFRLELQYAVGYNRLSAAEYLPDYLEYAGVGALSNVEFQQKLRAAGATIGYRAAPEKFSIVLEGFDDRFAESYALLREFVAGVTPDDKGTKSVVGAMKIARGALKRDADALSFAQAGYALYGENARELRKMTAAEVKKEDFVRDLHAICDYGANVFYSGGRSLQEVTDVVGDGLGSGAHKASERAYYPFVAASEPTVYLLDVTKSRQSIINAVVYTGDMTDLRERALANLFNLYFGGGSMSSLLFQQIREFRSYAYAVTSAFYLPKRYERETDGYFRVYMTTQTDKTAEAIATLDSLMRDPTFTPERLESAKMQLINGMNNGFPNFRRIASVAADFREQGYADDPREALFEQLGTITVADLQAFYERRIKGRPVVYAITTDTERFGEADAGRFGKVVVLKTKDIIK